MEYDIFISYRRAGGDSLAQLIFDRLEERGFSVFLDVETAHSGKFDERLLSVIEECRDLVLILSPGALERCVNPDGTACTEDWLYLEISHAMACGKNIIPVMMKGFEWPDWLPEPITDLPRHNGVEDNKEYFDAEIEKICSFLHTSTSAVGRFFQHMRRRLRKKKLRQSSAQKRKRLLTYAAFALVAAGALGLYIFSNVEQEKWEDSLVQVRVTPPGDMTVQAYNDAAEILEERAKIFCAGKRFRFDVYEECIEMQIPNDAFQGIDIDTVLRCYLCGCSQLYITDEDVLKWITLENEDIAGLSSATGSLDFLDPANYGLEGAETYTYTELELSDAAFTKLEDELGTIPEYLCLHQDDVGYYDLTYPGNGQKFYYLDKYQCDNIQKVMEYNFTGGELPQAMNFAALDAVIWEETGMGSTAQIGKYQCGREKLSGDVIVAQYGYDLHGWDGEAMQQGIYSDTVAVVKNRLDALGLPYAFGTSYTGENMFFIGTQSDKMGRMLLDMLFSQKEDLTLQNRLAGSVFIEADKIRLTKQDGKTVLELVYGSGNYSETRLQDLCEQVETNAGQKELSLCYKETQIASCAVADVQSTAEGTVVSFDNLCGWGIEEVGTEHSYLMDCILEILTGPDLPEYRGNAGYEMMGCILWGRDDRVGAYGIRQEDREKRMETMRGICREIDPDARIYANDTRIGYQNIYGDVTLPDAETFAKDTQNLLREIVRACNFNDGVFDIILSIDLPGGTSGDDMLISYRPSLYQHKMVCSILGEEAQKEEIQKLMAEDAFFADVQLGE